MNSGRNDKKSFIGRYSFLVLPAACALLLIVSGPLWQHSEFKAYDIRVDLCRHLPFARTTPSGKVVVVGIDEKNALKRKPFIFWYPDLGRFLKLMAKSGVTAVGVDVIPVHSLEQKLAESFGKIEGLDADSANLDRIGRQLDRSLVSGIMEASRDIHIVQGVSGSLVPFYYDLMAFMEHVEPASLQIKTDEDGILRSQPMKTGSSSESFVARLYRAAGEKGDVPQLIRLNYALMDRIPLYSFEEITGGTFDLNRLRGKTVIIGMVSMNDDVHATPLGMRPGTQVHATALETLITGTSPLATGFWFDCGLVLVLCLAAYPFTRFRSPFRSLFWVGIFTVCIGAANFGVFARGYAVSLLPSLLAPVAMFCVSYLYRYMVEERGRRLLYRTFSYYVEPNVIDQLITRDPETLMKGEQHDVCILFLDIRGFTALSERIPADAVVAMLNAFFGQVTEVVQEHRGFVNKFIGDGMLAFFAVGPSYVDDALQASIDICRVTERLNASGELTPFIGDSRLAVGVGLHAGPVILGNIGSQRKLDFTVIGQTVNTASRIESLTKQYSRSVLVSKTVREMAAAHFSFDSLGVTPVKGIEGGVEIYSLSICIDPL